MSKSPMQRAQEHLETSVPPPFKRNTPAGEEYVNCPPLLETEEDLMYIRSQEDMIAVIRGLQDSIGPEEFETEEEANDLDWPEPDPFSTEHTVREMVEETPLDIDGPPISTTGKQKSEAHGDGNDGKSEDSSQAA